MSYHTFIDYGYGINFSKVASFIELEEILAFVEEHPDEKHFFERFIPEDAENMTNEDWIDWMASGCDCDFYEEFVEFFDEVCGVKAFRAQDDYSGDWFLFIEPFYPWSAPTGYSELTTEKIDQMFTKYIPAFTGIPFSADEVGYIEVTKNNEWL
ncbi:MAG: hypothetical protein J5992_00455 [Oscillospiraceae bacterium]|nr:hypothetical protein [Oscillospiraceae bacterium]